MNRMKTLCLLTCYTLALLLSSTHADPWTVSISPPECVTITHGDSVTISCQTEPPQELAECGFQLAPPEITPLYADAKTANASYWNLTVEYDGEGLAGGRCQLRLTASPLYKEESFPVGCRVRVDEGGWKYGYTSIVDTSWHPKEISLSTDPKEAFLLPGSSLTVRCDSANHYKLEYCSFKLPGRGKFNLTAETPVDDFRYVGDGLDKFQCGIFIPDIGRVVSDVDDSITCETYITYRKIPIRRVRVNTARCLTGLPKLAILSNDENAVVVQCTAPSCRPPAALLWYVNGTLLPSTNVSETPDPDWRWQRDLQFTVQELTLGSASEVQGTTVQCVVVHVAASGLEGTIVIPSAASGSLGTLWIVLIVCAVIIVVVVVAIVIFAKYTERWCFSKGSRRGLTMNARRSSLPTHDQPPDQEAGQSSGNPAPKHDEQDGLLRKESTEQQRHSHSAGT